MDLQRQAEEFRYAYDVENSEANSDMQFDLIYEEFHEFKEAHTNMMAYVQEREQSNESLALKELADLVYVCFQYAANRDWDLNTAMDRVHRSNMSKLGEDGKPIRREDGKVLKGPNYAPPYLEDLCNLI
jgi:predicted HAD superfamily Cof-like phosphohydrolase